MKYSSPSTINPFQSYSTTNKTTKTIEILIPSKNTAKILFKDYKLATPSGMKPSESGLKLNGRTSSIADKNKSLWSVGRHDHYNDSLNHVLDDNIEQVAALIALKKALQTKIFDKTKEHAEIRAQVDKINQKNSEV